ncbi:hypothetical protein ERJ75_000107200 [Trypanosoma vivax]|nr:hypothetical protein ERJ75_000107200 [Trypanosoma vivax]
MRRTPCLRESGERADDNAADTRKVRPLPSLAPNILRLPPLGHPHPLRSCGSSSPGRKRRGQAFAAGASGLGCPLPSKTICGVVGFCDRVTPSSFFDTSLLEISSSSSSSSTSTLSLLPMLHRSSRYVDPWMPCNSLADAHQDGHDVAAEQPPPERTSRLESPFVIGCGGVQHQRTRDLLIDCARELYYTIVRDWEEAEPKVVFSAEDLIVVYINLQRVRRTAAVLRYMNNVLIWGDVTREFRLSKVHEGWGIVTEDGHLMYTFRPPWVIPRGFLPKQLVVQKAH